MAAEHAEYCDARLLFQIGQSLLRIRGEIGAKFHIQGALQSLFASCPLLESIPSHSQIIHHLSIVRALSGTLFQYFRSACEILLSIEYYAKSLGEFRIVGKILARLKGQIEGSLVVAGICCI